VEKGDTKYPRALMRSLNDAKRTALEVLTENEKENCHQLMDAIRVILDDEMDVRLDANNRSYQEGIVSSLKFQQFREFYSCDDLFPTFDIFADDKNVQKDSQESDREWAKKTASRLAGFALLRVSEGLGALTTLGNGKSDTKTVLFSASNAALDAWQAIELAQRRFFLIADKGENCRDKRNRNKEKSDAGVNARAEKRKKLLEEIGRLTDDYRKENNRTSNSVVAENIHDEVLAFAKKIDYQFKVEIKGDEVAPLSPRIARLIGEVRPKRKKLK